MATEKTTTKPAAKPAEKTTAKSAKSAVEKKPRVTRNATKHAVKEEAVEVSAPAAVATEAVLAITKPVIAGGRYVFATGRRKTAIANVRMFSGEGETLINKKKMEEYFHQSSMRDAAMRPLALTGLLNDFYFTAHVSGGGTNAQSEAVRHGIAQALASLNEDVRLVLKKNGFLTRDDRKKERKKPGLRGARRAPQWAKR